MRTKTTLKAPEGVTESQIEGTYYWPEEEEGVGAGIGTVQTTNENHAKILQQHGYAVIDVESLEPAQSSKGMIDVDELGRSQLLVALRDRGQSYPDTATRDELIVIANQWNKARRADARRAAEGDARAAPAPAAAPVPAPTVIEGMTHEQAIAELRRMQQAQAAPAPAPAPQTTTTNVIQPVTPAPVPAPAPEAPAPAAGVAVAGVAAIDFSKYGYDDLKSWLVARGVAFKGNASKSTLQGLAEARYAEITAAAAARVAQPETV